MLKLAFSRPARMGARLLARSARVAPLPIRWCLTRPRPLFDNQVGMLEIDGRSASLALEKAVATGSDGAGLEPAFARRLV